MTTLKRFSSKFAIFCIVLCFCINFVFSQNSNENFIVGVDLSTLQQYEDADVKFFDSENKEISDLLKFFCDKNLDCVRLRVWVNPELSEENLSKTDYCNLENTIKMAKRAKSLGMKVLIDFHYSDYWADPSQQKIPTKWQEKFSNNNSDIHFCLQNLIYEYTLTSLQKFKEAGIEVDFVQIGNEITNGLLFPYGKIKNSGTDYQKFSDTAKFLEQGILATRKIFPQTKIILHLDSSQDLNRSLWWYSCVHQFNLDYDIIGLSYYSLWQGKDLSQLEKNIKTLSQKFQKGVFIVETSYPWTLSWNDNLSNLYGMKNQLIDGFDATPKGQTEYFKKICDLVKTSVKDFPSAVFWWEPTAISSQNKNLTSTIENTTWFNFQNRYIGPL